MKFSTESPLLRLMVFNKPRPSTAPGLGVCEFSPEGLYDKSVSLIPNTDEKLKLVKKKNELIGLHFVVVWKVLVKLLNNNNNNFPYHYALYVFVMVVFNYLLMPGLYMRCLQWKSDADSTTKYWTSWLPSTLLTLPQVGVS